MQHPEKVINTADVSGLRLTDVLYPPDLRFPSHSHEEARFRIALNGTGRESFSGTTRECESLMLYFLPPDHSHSAAFLFGECHTFTMDVSSAWIEKVRSFSAFELNPFDSREISLVRRFLQLHKEFCFADELSPLAIEGLALEMFADVARLRGSSTEKKAPRWLIQAKEFLDAGFTEHLMLDTVADAVDMHPVHLVRQFRKHFNCTVGDYIRRKRIEYVCRELRCSDAPLVDIALAAGFCDQSHLTRVFKRMVGITPSNYRSTSRNQ